MCAIEIDAQLGLAPFEVVQLEAQGFDEGDVQREFHCRHSNARAGSSAATWPPGPARRLARADGSTRQRTQMISGNGRAKAITRRCGLR